MNRASSAAHPGLAVGARAFVFTAIAGTALWGREPAAVSALLTLATVWVTCTWLVRTRVPLSLITLVESLLVAMVAALYHDTAPAVLAALAIPPFVHGLTRGIRGVAEALIVQVVMLSAVLRVQSTTPHLSELSNLFTWLVTGLGLGLVASFFVSPRPSDDNSTAYLEARSLLAELNDLSARLVGGLDPASMATAVAEEVRAELPVENVVLHVERESRLMPLVSELNGLSVPAPALAAQAWEQRSTLVEGKDFAFVVSSAGAAIAVVSGRTSPGLEPDPAALAQRLDALALRLAPAALRLDTAQMFVAFRDSATSQERQRLAREMHDGMAQDIASMGYVVDALMTTATPVQEPALRQLRTMITGVVAEVRRSVMTLRTQPESNESLGAAIAALARTLSAVSGTPITVTVDERTRRLKGEVEGELLRIAQEAMNNAVKHAQASAIDVTCRVDAPYAEVTVQDDGRGLQSARRDSHGLAIMRERAALIDAELDLSSQHGRGTLVTVRVGGSHHVALAASHHSVHEGARQ